MRNLLLFAVLGLLACNSKPYPEEGVNKFSDEGLIKIYQLQDERNAKALIPFLKAKKESHRVQAALAFASLQDSIAIPYLSQVLQIDQDELPRRAAALALGQIGHPKSAEVLRRSFASETSKFNQRYILEAMGRCIDSASFAFLDRFDPRDELLVNGWLYGVYRALQQGRYSDSIENRVLKNMVSRLATDEQQIISAHYLHLLLRVKRSTDPDARVNHGDPRPHVKNEEALATLNRIHEMLSDVKEERLTYGGAWMNTMPDDPYSYAKLLEKLDPDVEADKIRIWLRQHIEDASVHKVVKNAAFLKLTEIERVRSFYPEFFTDLVNWALNSGDMALQSIACYAMLDEGISYSRDLIDPTVLDSLRWQLELPRQMETFIDLSKAMARWYGKDDQEFIDDYKRTKDGGKPMDWDYIKSVPFNQKVEIKTTKGDIIIRCFINDAPASVSNFIKLADSGFYDNKYFHRVVPNFVIQGGCPRGDGWGGLNWTQRSEFSNYQHYSEGTVGLASAGKDTEGVQWFITHNATPFLTGRYSIFARVIEGMDVVQQIEVGDMIISVNRIP